MERLRDVYGRLGAKLAYLKYEKGQTLIEYILVIVVVALAIIFIYESIGLNNTICDTLINLNQKINKPG
jgi:Flp pilus assembly pilin Flp